MNWLFLRGLARVQGHWNQFPKTFEKFNEGNRVFTLDLPGCGDATNKSAPLTVHGITEEIRKSWLKLRKQNPGSWSILGESLGGMIALDWCASHKKDFENLVVINSSANDVGKPTDRLSPRVLPFLLKAATGPSMRHRETAVLKMTTYLRDDDLEATLCENVITSNTYPIPISVSLRQVIAALRFKTPKKITAKTLVIRSLGDIMVNPTCSEGIARTIGAKLLTHQWGGHDLPLDDPEWLSKSIRDWKLNKD
jgi:pimeloyl-ACP methyl ester carboxylesterase